MKKGKKEAEFSKLNWFGHPIFKEHFVSVFSEKHFRRNLFNGTSSSTNKFS